MLKGRNHTFGKILVMLQGLLSLGALGFIYYLNVLPSKFMLLLAGILLFLYLFNFGVQYTKKIHILGKVLSVMTCLLMSYGCYNLAATDQFVSEITSYNYKEDSIVAVVAVNDPAESIYDAADYDFGILEVLDRSLVDQTMDQYNEQLEDAINYTTCSDLRSLIDSFNSGEVQGLIYNTTWNEPIEELEEGFSKTVKILDLTVVKTVKETEAAESKVVVTQDPFIAYISGVDEYGTIASTGRSDVNMIAVVNPQTHQILLVVTPRDYYIEFPGITNGNKDKLTHAGNFGVQTSMDTLGNLYDVDIDHYVRLNFTSFVDVVDALGGVTVYSEQTFTTRHSNVYISEGDNDLNGTEALAFVRERYNLAEGDFQRGRNQQALLTALIKKAMSPAILTGYSDILSSLGSNLDISMSSSDIYALVKQQLDENIDWNIVSVAAKGTTGSMYCYSLGTNASVVIPDEESVAEIKEMIQTVYTGGILSENTGTAY